MGFFPDKPLLERTSDEWLELLYDDRPMCATPPPLGYSISLTTAHLIAVPIYLAAFWTLYAEKSPNFKIYKKYLAFHAVSNFIFEFHLSFAMKPVLYLPYIVTRFVGTWKFRYLNGSIMFFIFLFIIGTTCWSIVELFHYRFKLISSSSLVSDWVKTVSSVLNKLIYLLILFTFLSAASMSLCIPGLFDQVIHKKKLKAAEIYPEIMCMSALTLPVGDSYGLKPIYIFNMFAILTCVLGIGMCIVMGGASLIALTEMISQTRTSRKTVSMHRTFLFSLFVQIGVHLVMLGFPIGIYIFTVITKLDANQMGYAAIVLASMHGAMATLAMILFNRPLYELIFNKIKSIFTPNNVVVRNLSFVSMLQQSR